jgi:uncharacterized membrane protein YjgN (DUF898 family)
METKNYRTSFLGNGMDLFKIQLVNFILTLVTLGFYYPWAKAKKLQYLYSNSTLEEHPFAFTGTGKEMFKGFIKAIILFIIAYTVFAVLIFSNHSVIGLLFFYLFLLLILPFAIHGSYRYRMSKTVWKGIRFGYSGDLKELIQLFFKGIFLTIITFGIYGAWFATNLRSYLLGNIKMGNANFSYKAEGDDFFWMNTKGYLLTIFTLGIYFFWWQKQSFEFLINNTVLIKDDKIIHLQSKAKVSDFFSLLIINLLIIIFTLGIGYAWVVVRNMNFITNNVELEGNINLDSLMQTQEEYSNATGEDMADMLDLGLTI